MAENTEPCGIDGCTKTPPTTQGLAIHRGRAHGISNRKGTKHDDADPEHQAIRRAEHQPADVEEKTDGNAEDDLDAVIAKWIISRVSVDPEELELIEAMRFLFGFESDDDLMVQALNDLLAWARDDDTVKKLLRLRASLSKEQS